MNLRALLELMRVSNLPTVWSNVIVGIGAGIVAYDHAAQTSISSYTELPTSSYPILSALVASIAVSCIYSAGMAMNDIVDRMVDSVERPTRPIPSGRISMHLALVFTVCLFVVAWPLLIIAAWLFETRDHDWPTIHSAIALLIVLVCSYNLIHQRFAWSVLVMGFCRFTVVVTSALLIARPQTFEVPPNQLLIVGPAATVLIYTLAISIVARREVEPGSPDGPRKFGGPRTVMNMIAAMPLLDAVWLVVMGLWPASVVCVGCSVLTKLGHRKVAGS